MHPKALLEATSELVLRVLRLDHPADAVVSHFFREHRNLGPRERATLAETAYAVLRRKPQFEHLARAGSGSRERRLAILGFAAPRDFLKQALNEAEKQWLNACDAVPAAELPPACRHNLPAWLVGPLREQVGDEFDALAAALLAPAPLDLRVNTLKENGLQRRQNLRKKLSNQ